MDRNSQDDTNNVYETSMIYHHFAVESIVLAYVP
jgi:hypothetical protein